MKQSLFERLYYKERSKVTKYKAVNLILLAIILLIFSLAHSINKENIMLHMQLNNQLEINTISSIEYENEISVLQNKYNTQISATESRIDVFQGQMDELHSELLKTFYTPNIPLKLEQQRFIHFQCDKYDVDYEVILALMSLESNYNINAINNSNNNGTTDYGIMQINDCNINSLNKHFGRQLDYMDFEDNVMAGVYYFSTIQDVENVSKTLLKYNQGSYGSSKYYNKYLTYDSAYVRIILSKVDEIKSMREGI